MSWQDDLQPASWRGVPFYVDAGTGTFGRNTAVHAYPFVEKNQSWVEDLGRAIPAIRITGFLLGDDVREQHLAFFKAVNAAGSGELVHPVYGSQNGSIVGGCTFRVRRDKGRFVELSFNFVQHNDRPYPPAAADSDRQDDARERAAQSRGAAAATYQQRTGATGASALQDSASDGAGHASSGASNDTGQASAGASDATGQAAAAAAVPAPTPATVPTPAPASVPGAEPAVVPPPWSAEPSQPPTITVTTPDEQGDDPAPSSPGGALTS